MNQIWLGNEDQTAEDNATEDTNDKIQNCLKEDECPYFLGIS